MNILNEKRRLLPMGGYMLGGGGSGGGGGPSNTTVQNTNIPEYARPYVENMLGATQQQLFNVDTSGNITGAKPYQAFGQNGNGMGSGEMQAAQSAFAGFTPMQQQAFQGAANMQMPGQFADASNAAAQATSGAMNAGANYNPSYFGNQYQAPSQYNAGQFSYGQAQAPQLQNYQMGPAQQVGTQDYTGQNVSQYMSPYMQNVVDTQQREAQRQSDILGTQQAGQAVQQGAFGGSRAGLLEAERQRNLATQKENIQATGSQAAFQNAQQQFNQQQQANLQAQQANQNAGLTTGQQNLAANLGIQQLGSGQNMQAQLANQQAMQAAQQAAEQSRQYGYGQNMASAQNAAQYGLGANQLNAQQQQFGANLGLQGYQAGMQGASTLGSLGNQQLAAQQGIYGLQNQFGQQQQGYNQNVINQAIQNYANTQQYPQQQLAFMNSMLRGLPLQTQTTASYQAAPSAISQLGGLGLAGAGAYKLATSKKGGAIKAPKETAAGLAELALMKMA